MYQIDFQKPIHIHFIGIGGISMSGLAFILLDQGFRISGSDTKESPLTRKLTQEGAAVYYGQTASNIEDTPDLVVYTAAIHPDNPEYAAAVSMQLPMLSRAELLGQFMKNYKTPIAVSGTHGKTTTTSMASHILLEAGTDPQSLWAASWRPSMEISGLAAEISSLPRRVNTQTAFYTFFQRSA